jgi:hypothetical protein
MTQPPPTTTTPPHAVVLQMLFGRWISSAIATVARFGIADHLESGPRNARDLAALTGTNEEALYRLLRATASLGVFTELEDGRFAQTPLSEPLRSGANPCLRNMAMMFLDDWFTRNWAQLPWSVQTGRSASYKVFGKSPWEVFRDEPDLAVNFNHAMTDMSQADSPAIAGAYPFSSSSTSSTSGEDSGGCWRRFSSPLLRCAGRCSRWRTWRSRRKCLRFSSPSPAGAESRPATSWKR